MTIDFLDSRYVFFFSCIDSVGDEMSQFLAGIDEFFPVLACLQILKRCHLYRYGKILRVSYGFLLQGLAP